MYVHRYQAGHPSVAVDDIGRPSEFFHGLEHPFAEDYHSVLVVVEELFVLIREDLFSPEKFFVVEKIHLKPGPRQGGYLYDKWVVVIIDNDVHTAEPHDFVE